MHGGHEDPQHRHLLAYSEAGVVGTQSPRGGRGGCPPISLLLQPAKQCDGDAQPPPRLALQPPSSINSQAEVVGAQLHPELGRRTLRGEREGCPLAKILSYFRLRSSATAMRSPRMRQRQFHPHRRQ
jgi:hypothetical protein